MPKVNVRGRLVDPETGIVTAEACPGCFKRDEEIAALKVEKRGWRTRYYNLSREIRGNEDHELWPAASRLFKYWKEACNHPRTKWKAEHFKAIQPYLRDYGEQMCRYAIEGAAYEPFTTKRKNGSVKRHDDWNLIFRSPDKFTEFANRAPHHLPKPEHISTLAKALEHLGLPLEQAIEEARRRLS